MDYWFSWLSKTSLDRSAVYEYGLMFIRNELEEDDKKFFNHEFLQSMGISVAKHRLEILKLVKKEAGDNTPHRGLSLFLAISRAKRCISKRIGKHVFFGETTAHVVGPKATPFRTHWNGALRKQRSSNEFNIEKVMVTNRSPIWSGPMDRRVQERLTMVPNRSRMCVSGPLDEKPIMSINKSPTSSGPLDGRVQERFLFSHKSPDLSWPCDSRDFSPKVNNSQHGKEKMSGGNGVQPLWSLMFQDMKPT
ncbi:hypothetical protein U1Q18_028219 [Sarracenia purpurea var. burkii]